MKKTAFPVLYLTSVYCIGALVHGLVALRHAVLPGNYRLLYSPILM